MARGLFPFLSCLLMRRSIRKPLLGAIRERETSLTDPAKFTSSSQNLVMKVDPEGRILCANQGVEQALYGMGLPIQHSEILLPDDAVEIVRELIASKGKKRRLTCEIEGKTIEYMIFRFEDEDAVVFHGVDVTENKSSSRPGSAETRLTFPEQEK